MNKSIDTVYVLNRRNKDDEGITELIRSAFGEKTIITMIRSPRYYDAPHGFANLAVRHKKKKNALVCANKIGLEDRSLENAAKTGASFAVVYANSCGKWEGFRVGILFEATKLLSKNLTAAETKNQ
ncbi:MAG: hypothetical protein AAB621_02095 [Patescibacteria group bacterium]